MEKLHLISDQYNFVASESTSALILGRLDNCQWKVPEVSISRRHCQFGFRAGGWYVCDLGSRHGIRVNGRMVEEVRLQPGDEVAIGPILFRFEGQPAMPPAPAAPSRPGPVPASAAHDLWDADDSGLDLIPLDDL